MFNTIFFFKYQWLYRIQTSERLFYLVTKMLFDYIMSPVKHIGEIAIFHIMSIFLMTISLTNLKAGIVKV